MGDFVTSTETIVGVDTSTGAVEEYVSWRRMTKSEAVRKYTRETNIRREYVLIEWFLYP